jgi:hypothetical protein
MTLPRDYAQAVAVDRAGRPIAAMQLLPAKQRAVLVLRDGLCGCEPAHAATAKPSLPTAAFIARRMAIESS